MYRLALIALESGACVANPVYETEQECFDQINTLESNTGTIQLDTDVDGRKYIVPARLADFVVVVEPLVEEEH